MSVIHTNNITNKDGTSGPTISGITTVSSSGFMRVPVGDTFRRQVLENVVDSGLVLYLDAGNDISYPGSGTTWYDLSGNVNGGTLVNGVGFTEDNGGSLSFDGVDDMGIVPSQNFNAATTQFTVSVWKRGSHLQLRSNGNGNNLEFEKTRIQIYSNGINYYSSSISSTEWVYSVAVIKSATYVEFFINGTFDTSHTVSIIDDIFNSETRLGHRELDTGLIGQYFGGNIAQVSIYNRALTPQEIQQNYNATKYRYEN